MIKSLRIKNLILVQDIEIEFNSGLNVLTGETGTGKSVIAGAFALLLGQRVRPGLFYDEDKPIYLETVFDLSGYIEQKMKAFPADEDSGDNSGLIDRLLAEGYLCIDSHNCSAKEQNSEGEGVKNYEIEDKELIITREILPDNSSRIYLNGKRVTIGIIKEYRDKLIDFHSQRDQIKLFSPAYQLEIIDNYGNLDNKLAAYQRLYREISKKQKRLEELQQKDKEQTEKQRLFAFQIAELEELDLKPDEEKLLKQELDLLTHSEDILNYCSELEQKFYEKENSFFDQVNSFKQRFERFSGDQKSIQNVVLSLKSVLEILNDVQRETRNISDLIDLDQNKLRELEERMNEILRVKNKYKMEIPELLEYLTEMKRGVEEHRSGEKEIEFLQGKINDLARKLRTQAADLSLDRKTVSKKLTAEIKADIRRLAIPEGDFEVLFEKRQIDSKEEDIFTGLDMSGADRVSFLFSANKGGQLQPLKNSVSGGELSRLLLVIKRVLAGRLDTLSLVFDEIDSGIGGRTANRLGEYISEVGKYHQVLCITHLPQIAVNASKHFAIEKKINSGRSLIEIRELDVTGRKEEIARMLAGSQSLTAMKHAEELLNKN
jgi:DNA repair protein RecN (Recombination protein N)